MGIYKTYSYSKKTAYIVLLPTPLTWRRMIEHTKVATTTIEFPITIASNSGLMLGTRVEREVKKVRNFLKYAFKVFVI